MKKRAIPKIPSDLPAEQKIFLEAVKERLEVISGARGTTISQLDPNYATLQDVARKVNEILDLLQ